LTVLEKPGEEQREEDGRKIKEEEERRKVGSGVDKKDRRTKRKK
jgi:hypothetical protein